MCARRQGLRYVLVVLLVLVLAALVLSGCEVELPSVHAQENEDHLIHLPLVLKKSGPIAPTPTVVPPTATPEIQWIPFLTGYDNNRMKGLITGSVRRASLPNFWGGTVYPMGVFIVLFMDVQNCELESAYASGINTFWLRSGSGPYFDMAPLDAQWAAQDEYSRIGVYRDLQPQFIYRMVFVFDVPPGASYALWYRPWGSSGSELTKVIIGQR